MNTKINPGYWKSLTIGFDEALGRMPEALKAEGFGLVTEMDLQATFKAKLGLEFRRYRILGACNPGFAHKAVSANPHVGLLLPCNVALYEDDEGHAVVGIVDPMQTLGGTSGDTSLQTLAAEVGERLKRVLEAFPGTSR